jgi:hypothetical protein
VFENWFIASVKNSDFVNTWLDEFNRVVLDHNNNGLDYVSAVNAARRKKAGFAYTVRSHLFYALTVSRWICKDGPMFPN